MSPPDFDMSPKLKKPLRGKRFRSIEEVSNEVTRVIRRINNQGLLTGIQDLPKRWDCCDKAQQRLHWRPVNVFCKINSFLKRKCSVQNFWNDPRTNITKCKNQVFEQWIKLSIPLWVHDYHLHDLKSSITDWLTDWIINWLGQRPISSSYLVGHTHSARRQLDPLSRWRRKPCSNPIFWEPFSYFWADPSAAGISPSSILVLLLSPLVKSGNKTTDSNMKLMKFKWNCNIT